MRPSQLWAAAAVALGIIVAACSVGSKPPTVPAAGSRPTTTSAPAGGGSGTSEHNALPAPRNSTGQELSPAQQQAWLSLAKCIRGHGVPNLPDPTFSGDSVQISSREESNSPQFRRAVDACKSQVPSAGGLGG